MNVIWITNVPPVKFSPSIREVHLGSWLKPLYCQLKKQGVNIYSIFPSRDSHIDAKYSTIPTHQSPWKKFNLEDQLDLIIKNFKPDLIHIHGTEMNHSFLVSEYAKKKGIPYIVSLQGIVSEIGKVTTTGLPIDVIKGRTLRDLFLRSSILDIQKKYTLQSKKEKSIAEGAKLVLGRTSWDKSWTFLYTTQKNYRKINEPLREEFFQSDLWSYDGCEKHQIFMTQGSTSIKGIIFALEAINLLKTKYPSIKLIISGKLISNNSLRNKILQTNFEKFIVSKIKLLDLNEKVRYIGYLDAKNLVKQMKISNIFLLPSLIENSPNSLMEAACLAVPSVATYVGGIPDSFPQGEKILFTQPGSSLGLANSIDIMFQRKFTESKRPEFVLDATNLEKIGTDTLSVYYEATQREFSQSNITRIHNSK